MGKTVICHTLEMSTIIIVLCSCMVTTCTCICTRVSKNSRFQAVYVHKKSSLIWQDPFLAQGVYCLRYKHLAKALSMVIMLRSYLYVLNYLAGPAHNCMQHALHSASYYFHLKLWTEYSYLQLCAYRLEFECQNHLQHPLVASYNFNVSIYNCSESVLLLNRVLHWMQQVNIRKILRSCQVPPTTHN